MRDRLIDLLKTPHKAEKLRDLGIDISRYESDTPEAMIADFLLANGVIVPPVMVGDEVYSIVPTYSKCHLGISWDEFHCQGCEDECDSHGTYAIRQERVIAIAFNGASWEAKTYMSGGNYKLIGESIYGLLLTKEQAEKALAERSGK